MVLLKLRSSLWVAWVSEFAFTSSKDSLIPVDKVFSEIVIPSGFIVVSDLV